MQIWFWIFFIGLIFLFLALDLGLLNRRPHAIGTKEALAWTLFWFCLALLFNVLVYFIYEHHWFRIESDVMLSLSGKQAALQFLTGYLVEVSLSLDNIFVISLILIYFQVPLKFQHRVLFWGIMGALVLRGIMIGLGAYLVARFVWMVYVFGVILIITAIKMLFDQEESVDLNKNKLVRWARRIYPVYERIDSQHFFVKKNGILSMTPLFLALLVVESSDVMFAVDSIPAIFAITSDPFIVFTSNIFAILGLRSLYFALASLLDKFRYLKVSLVIVLAFVGVKMIATHYLPIPTWVSLVVICSVLTTGALTSVFVRKT